MFEFFDFYILPLFIGGLLWESIIALAVIVLLAISFVHQSFFSGFLATLIMGLFLYANFSDTIVPAIYNHPYMTVAAVAAYIVLGGAYSVMKWFFYLRSDRMIFYIKRVKEGYKDYKTRNPAALLDQYINMYGTELLVSNNKERITVWIAWWPANLVWTLIDDVLFKIWTKVYEMLSGIYNKILHNAIEKY